ncbi:MAG TPA: hypothetical protein VE420_11840 [Gemmatimonadales bacterium]|nr:hypothetical protein [Gemmatimonadales bacterium]
MQSLKQQSVFALQDTARSRQPPQYPLLQVWPPQHGWVALQDRPWQGEHVPPRTRKSQEPEQQDSPLVHDVPSGSQQNVPAMPFSTV